MARGRTSHSRSAALALRAPRAGASGADPLSPLGADWASAAAAPSADAATRRGRRARAIAASTACLIAGATWLAAPGAAQAAVGDPAAADCEPGVALALETAPPAKVVNDGTGVEKWSFTICARQTVARVQTRVARLKDPRLDASASNLESVTPDEILPGLNGTRSYSVPSGLAAGSYAIEVSYFTPDGRMADRAASVFRVGAPAVTPPPATPDPAPPTPVASPPTQTPFAVPPATPRAEPQQRAKLRLVKTGDRTKAGRGQKIRWTLNLSNVGQTAARKVELCDLIPSGLILVSAPGAHMSRGEVCWSLKSLAKGATKKVGLVTRVDGSITSTRMITNRARASASNANTVRAKANVIGVATARPIDPAVTG